MKITILSFVLSAFTFVNSVKSQVQEWQNIAEFEGLARSGAVSFVIGDTAYVGLGASTSGVYFNDFYKYDVENNTWTQIDVFPGVARTQAVAFTIDGKAYVGTGYNDSGRYADFYEYDPSTGNWQSIASIPIARNRASSFSINNKGYVGLGYFDGDELSDFYEYDPSLDRWSLISGVGTDNKRSGAVGFAANGKGYIASGQKIEGFTSTVFTDLRSYNPDTDSWTEEIFASSNLSSLQQNTVYIDQNGLVHILKTASTNKQTILDLTDNSTSTGDYYFDDERRSSTVFYLDNTPYAGLGYISSGGSTTYQSSFRKLVTIESPLAPTIDRIYNSWDGTNEYSTVYWTNNEDENFDGNIIYLSKSDNSNYKVIDTVSLSSTFYKIANEKLDQNTKHYVKIAAYRGAAVDISNELDFIPIFREGKINPPKIISITTGKSIEDKKMELISYDLPETVVLERSINNSGFTVIDTLGITSHYGDTTTFDYSDTFETNTSSISYRVRLIDNSGERISSNYSNEVDLDINNLPATVGKIEALDINQSSSYFWIDINVEGLVNTDDIVLQYKNVNDTTFTNDTIGFYNARIKSYQEYDSLEARIIVSNQFSADTSNLIQIHTPLFAPFALKSVYSSVNAVGLTFRNNSNKNTGTIVERSINEESFVAYDTIPPNRTEYYDDNIEESNQYFYRFYNYGDKDDSKKSEQVKINATNMGAWKKFNSDGLNKELDSIAKYSMEYKFIEDGKIFFLSTKHQKFYQYSIDSLKLTRLEDFPDTAVNYINAPSIHNGIIYCFSAVNDSYEELQTIYTYDTNIKEWDNSLNIPFIDYRVDYSYLVNDKLYLIMANESNKYSIGYYDLTSQTWTKKDYDFYNVSPDYVTHNEDSLIVFDASNGKISYNFQTAEINRVDNVYNYENRVSKKGLVNYKDELLHLEYNSINKVELSNNPTSNLQKILPVNQDGEGYAFVYDGRLFYGVATDYRSTYSSNGFVYKDTDLLYYLDEEAPLKAANLQVDSIGITGAKLSWLDSPNDNGYYIEIIQYDSVLISDTLMQNQVQYTIDGLDQERYHSVQLRAINTDFSSSAVKVWFRTKRGRPYPPQNPNAKALSSSEILYTWDPIDTTEIPVDSLVFIDFNAESYVLNITDTSFLYRGLDELESPAVSLYTKNQYGSDGASFSGDNHRTYLNTPEIVKVAVHEKAGFYELIFKDKSIEENYYIIYRKSPLDTAFARFDSISMESFELAEENIRYEDRNVDLNMQYEYYLLANYQGAYEYSDTTIYYTYVSLPTDVVSTENAVLAVNPYLDTHISIYPNPSDHEIFIKVEDNVYVKRIEVLNVNGSIVKDFEKNESYNISELNEGLYFIKIYTDQGETTKKIIKR